MADGNDDKIILKILSGLQSGVEVMLSPGDYVVGTGAEDDIQLVDVSLKPGHARLRIAGGKILVAGGSGPLRTRNGLEIAAGADFQEVEPLDIITAGTARFALGRRMAQWSTLADDTNVKSDAPPSSPRQTQATGGRAGLRLLVPVLGLLVAVALVAGYVFYTGGVPRITASASPGTDLETVRNEISALPFAKRLEIKEEADGRIFVSGYVESPAERRAVLKAIETTGVPAFARVWVLAGIEAEVKSFVESSGLNVTYQLSPNGKLALSGVVLDGTKADAFISKLQQDVAGLGEIASDIKTAVSFFNDIKDLAVRARIADAVVLRLDGELVEASGAVPNDKVDAWVGFLQAYSQRYATLIGLRSFVTLQGVQAGEGKLQAVVLGAAAKNADPGSAVALDLDKLRDGAFSREDLFAKPNQPPAPIAAAAEPVAGAENGASVAVAPVTVTKVSDQPIPALETAGESLPLSPMDRASRSLANNAENAIEDFRRGGSNSSISDAIHAMAEARDVSPAVMAENYLAIFRDPRSSAETEKACRPNGLVTQRNLPAILFWLDLLSVNPSTSLSTFDSAEQQLILEAALNPTMIRKCGSSAAETASRAQSIYLEEAAKNPGFVRYITRSLPAYDLKVAGAHLVGSRFVQTASGQKLAEGSAPSAEVRVASIGELGLAVQKPSGFEAVIYGGTLAWQTGP